MTRIHFTFDDIARTCLAESLNPAEEAVFALDALSDKQNTALASWRRTAVRRLGELTDVVAALCRQLRPVPDLLWLTDRRARPDDDRLAAAGLTGSGVASLARQFAEGVVVPCWPSIANHFGTMVRRKERESGGGVHALLSTLHPRIRWHGPALDIDDDRAAEIRLAGRGLTVVHSAFLSSAPAVLIGRGSETDPPALVVSALPQIAGRLRWSRERDPSVAALSALLGRTRATLLWQLSDTCTTGELAKRAGVSAATVSQHTGILREAGLITTARQRNTVHHSLTVLGRQLVR
ncbi:winged helix-turn-helix domain-containing protein [Saccharothrix sp. AJ9571]|nr:winged helix-turn-helix domain-containing protein [Saccharothrix sp. AJ9571]